MPLEPGSSDPAEVVTFRCPAVQADWLRRFVKKGVKLSQAAAWAMGLAHEYWDLLRPISDDVTAAAKADGITRPMLVGRLLELGWAAYERERKSKR